MLLSVNDQLLNYEPQAADQVPLLLEMKEDKLALTKAVTSGDTDLGVLTKLSSKSLITFICSKTCVQSIKSF